MNELNNYLASDELEAQDILNEIEEQNYILQLFSLNEGVHSNDDI